MARIAALLIAAGLPGVLSLLLVLPAIEGVPRAALLVNPLVLLAGMAFAGAWAAPRCGFAIAPAGLARRLPAMLALGAALGLVVALIDLLTHPLWASGTSLPATTGGWSIAQLLSGMLYGGVTEEIIMRWGLMSLITRGLRCLLRSRDPATLKATLVAGAALSSLLFAAGHLPALAQASALLPGVVLRTLALNLAAGLVFAGVFAHHGLVAAMACHAAFHGGLAVAAGLAALA